MRTKRLLFLMLFTAVIIFAVSCTNSNKGDLSLSPFAQFESWSNDESGVYTDGKRISDTLKQYGILDSILTDINNDDLTNFNACAAEISGYSVKDKKVALLLLKQGGFHIYVLFSESGNAWKCDGYTYQRERFEPEYRIEKSDDGSLYWLVLKHESNHGTGTTLFDEIWVNPDGSIAAQYPLSGWVDFYPENTSYASAEYSCSNPYYDGGSKIILDYTIKFSFNYKEKFQSVYSPVVREYWVYDLQKSEFAFKNAEPDLPFEKNTVSDDYGIIAGYLDYYKTRVEEQAISSIEEWENLMEPSAR